MEPCNICVESNRNKYHIEHDIGYLNMLGSDALLTIIHIPRASKFELWWIDICECQLVNLVIYHAL